LLYLIGGRFLSGSCAGLLSEESGRALFDGPMGGLSLTSGFNTRLKTATAMHIQLITEIGKYLALKSPDSPAGCLSIC
jgi:hypothetical protein